MIAWLFARSIRVFLIGVSMSAFGIPPATDFREVQLLTVVKINLVVGHAFLLPGWFE